MASVTDISVDSAQTTTYVLASLLQLFQTYLLVRCNTSRHACWWCAIVTDMPGGTVHLLHNCLQFKSKVFKVMGSAACLLVWRSCVRHDYWSGALVSDMCAGPVLHNQTCVIVKMSADTMAIMDMLLD